jgi:hypothetical protein
LLGEDKGAEIRKQPKHQSRQFGIGCVRGQAKDASAGDLRQKEVFGRGLVLTGHSPNGG